MIPSLIIIIISPMIFQNSNLLSRIEISDLATTSEQSALIVEVCDIIQIILHSYILAFLYIEMSILHGLYLTVEKLLKHKKI